MVGIITHFRLTWGQDFRVIARSVVTLKLKTSYTDELMVMLIILICWHFNFHQNHNHNYGHNLNLRTFRYGSRFLNTFLNSEVKPVAWNNFAVNCYIIFTGFISVSMKKTTTFSKWNNHEFQECEKMWNTSTNKYWMFSAEKYTWLLYCCSSCWYKCLCAYVLDCGGGGGGCPGLRGFVCLKWYRTFS